MISRKLVLLCLSVLCAGLLAGCKSTAERADQHFQSGAELIESGDLQRGMVELRNALQLDERHKEARRLFARTLYEQGDTGAAYGEYQRFTEFFPEDVEGRITLSELALEVGRWDDLERHLKPAREARPEDLRVRILDNALAFRAALEGGDRAAEARLTEAARALSAEAPENMTPRQVMINGLLRQGEMREGLAEIEAALDIAADNFELQRLRLAILNDLGQVDAVETHLLEMVRLFPDTPEPRQTLLQWYMSRKEADKAEAFLRRQAETGGDSDNADLVRFLIQVRGPEVAGVELDRLIAQGDNPDYYRALRAGLDFDAGRRSEALAALETILATAEPSDQTRNIKVTLARLRWITGNPVGARELIEEVLAEDATQVEAMKLKAAWLTEDDKTDEATLLLRAALEQSPQDASIYTLMARTYERAGANDLVGEMLSRAVEVAANAPAESLRYARFLAGDGKDLPAEQILIDALRKTPADVELLRELGGVYLRLEDWARLTQVIDTLGRLEGNAAAAGLQKDLRLAMLRAQDKGAEALKFLESLTLEQGAETAEDARARLGIIRTHLQNGDRDKTRAALDEALARYPDSLAFRAMDARLRELEGQPEEAIAGYRALLAENPALGDLWRELYAALRRAGREEEATQALDDGIAAVPASTTLKWIKASELEEGGAYDAAIALYEELYARNSANLIVANNLASLLTSYRDDAESLDRAYTVARRLRGSDQPYFQDTYGWIAFRRGDIQEALEHLEPAAAADVGHPSIHYHLGMAYVATGQFDKAQEQFARAVEIAGPANTSPEMDRARKELAGLVSGETQKAAEQPADQ